MRQARRLPAALARFPISRLVSSPQRRAVQTAEPVAAATGLSIHTDERLAEYDRGMSHYIPLEQVRTERPGDWERMSRGQLPPAVDAEEFLEKLPAELGEAVRRWAETPRVQALREESRLRLAKLVGRAALAVREEQCTLAGALRFVDWIEPLLRRESDLALLV